MRRRLLLLFLPALIATGCGPRTVETSLVFNVEPTPEGARIEVLVESGPPGATWIGFGVGPGVPPSRVDRVSEVRARAADGEELPVRPMGEGGFAIERRGDDPWQFSYRLDLAPTPDDTTFYRASVRGSEYLVLVGSDAWPRLYADPRPLSFAPDNRPPGRADRVRTTLDVPVESNWQVVAAARDVTRRSFRFDEHPATTVILAGAFGAARATAGLEMRVHAEWDVLRSTVASMTETLATDLRERLGPPSDRDALAVMLPLPQPLRPTNGLRTAGMVRGRTVLLYGGLSDDANRRSSRIREAMAVFIGHELFHLYIPTAVPVARDLSWMSEGWAMHMGRLIAQDGGYVDPSQAEIQLRRTYRRYLDMGGYRAGSLPEASMGSESQRDLLYLRGELVFRLLAREWEARNPTSSFEEHLWRALTTIDPTEPLAAAQVSAVLESMVGVDVVRRYVQGTAPLTQGVLGID